MTAPLGLIAGLGDLPVSIAENAVQTGQGVYVLRLKGFEEPRLAAYPGDVVGLGEVGKLYTLLKKAGCKDVLFAGAQTSRTLSWTFAARLCFPRSLPKPGRAMTPSCACWSGKWRNRVSTW